MKLLTLLVGVFGLALSRCDADVRGERHPPWLAVGARAAACAQVTVVVRGDLGDQGGAPADQWPRDAATRGERAVSGTG